MGLPAWGISLLVAGGGMGLQYLFAPRVKQTPVDKGKFDDIRIQGSDYGAFIPRIRGTVRLGGNLIFSDGIDHEIINSPSDGGKGGPTAPAERTHIYRSSLGVLVCRGEILDIFKIWADTDLVLGSNAATTGNFEAEDGTLTGGATAYSDGTASGGDAVTGLGSGGKVVINCGSVATPPFPNFDPDDEVFAATRLSFFYKCAADKIATIDTDVTTAQNITLLNSGGVWTSHTIEIEGFCASVSYEYLSAATADLDKITVEKFWRIVPAGARTGNNVTGIVNPNIAYPANLDDPSAYYDYPIDSTKDGGTGIYDLNTSTNALRIYSGTETQTQDATIVAWLDDRYGTGEGTLRASAHRGLVYVLFEAFQLQNGRVPNFTFEVDAGDNTVNDVLLLLFDDVGITSGDCTLTATSGLSFTGWIEHTRASRRSLVEQLERYFQFRLAEIDGKIVTVADTGTSAVTFSADDLRAHAENEDWPAFDAEVLLKEEHLLPREIRFSVMNPAAEYHNETATAFLFSSVSGTETKEYTFPLVESLDDARLQAEKAILKEYAENVAYEFFAMPEYAKWSIGDVITVPINGVDCLMRIEKKQMMLPVGRIRFQCISTGYTYPDVIFQDDSTALNSRSASNVVQQLYPRNSIIFAIPSEPLYDHDKGKLGVYLAISGRGRGAWSNCGLYREYATDNYVLQKTIDSPSPVGLCAGTLANHGGGTVTEDTVNTLDIWFFDDIELETVTQPELDRLPTLNLVRVGDEWVQFRTATAQTLEANSPYRSKWRISNLWRGRFGTSAEIGSHGAGEYAAHVTPALRFYELQEADIGEVVNLKAVTGGQNVDNAPVTSFTFTPVSKYTVSNEATTRVFDANDTTLHQLADVVGTMINDLKI